MKYSYILLCMVIFSVELHGGQLALQGVSSDKNKQNLACGQESAIGSNKAIITNNILTSCTTAFLFHAREELSALTKSSLMMKSMTASSKKRFDKDIKNLTDKVRTKEFFSVIVLEHPFVHNILTFLKPYCPNNFLKKLLPDSYKILRLETQINNKDYYNPFLKTEDKKRYHCYALLFKCFFYYVSHVNNSIVDKPIGLLLNQSYHEITAQMPFAFPEILPLLIRNQANGVLELIFQYYVDQFAIGLFENLFSQANKKFKLDLGQTKVNQWSQECKEKLNSIFVARQCIFLTLALLSCLGIRGTENRILFNWKYLFPVGVGHVFFNKYCASRIQLSEDFLFKAPFFRDRKADLKKYVNLLTTHTVPISAGIAFTLYEHVLRQKA